MCTYMHYYVYVPFSGKLLREKTFTNSYKTLKFAKVFSLESFPPYSMFFCVFVGEYRCMDMYVWGLTYMSPSVFLLLTLSWSSVAVSCISPPPP